MDNISIQWKLFLAMVVLTLSSNLPTLAKAQPNDTENSKLRVVGDEALLEEGPTKCPIGEECLDESEVFIDSDTTGIGSTSQNVPLPPKRLVADSLNETKGSNSGISAEETERAMNDAPSDVPQPGTDKSPTRAKGRSKADKKLKRKNRRRKCRERRRKMRLERRMRKGRGGILDMGGEGMAKRQRKGGKKNKMRKQCGRRRRRKGRKRRMNQRKRSKGKLNKGKSIDTSKTTNATSDSLSEVPASGEKMAEMKSKSLASDSSHSSVRKARPAGASGSPRKIVINSNKGVSENAESSSTSEQEFDAIQITALFHEVFQRDSNGNTYVNLENYVKAYRRLVSVFQFFGTIFSFAKSDLEEKIDKLGELRHSSLQGQDPESYHSFKNMFEYEYANGIAQPGGPAPSGVRENAWIHRALKFIIAIVRTVADPTDTSALSSRVKQFYSEILAPHHSWLVRMGVYAAIPMFPSRDMLLKDMKIQDDAEGMRELTRLADSAQAVYDSIQVHYEKYTPSK